MQPPNSLQIFWKADELPVKLPGVIQGKGLPFLPSNIESPSNDIGLLCVLGKIKVFVTGYESPLQLDLLPTQVPRVGKFAQVLQRPIRTKYH